MGPTTFHTPPRPTRTMPGVFTINHKAFRCSVLLFILGLLFLITLRRNESGNSTSTLNGLIARLSGYIRPTPSASSEGQLHSANNLDPELRWNNTVPPTKIIAHAPGWTIF